VPHVGCNLKVISITVGANEGKSRGRAIPVQAYRGPGSSDFQISRKLA